MTKTFNEFLDEYIDKAAARGEDVYLAGMFARDAYDSYLAHISEPVFSKVPKYAAVMTVKDFIEECVCGTFYPSDGSGCFMRNSTEESDVSVWSMDVPPAWATHVAWYNK